MFREMMPVPQGSLGRDESVLIAVGGLHWDAFSSTFNNPPEGYRLVCFVLERDGYQWMAVLNLFPIRVR